jgi:hypothetical protein
MKELERDRMEEIRYELVRKVRHPVLLQNFSRLVVSGF